MERWRKALARKSAYCRLAVCEACGDKRIIDADDDKYDCPTCDRPQVATRVHPRDSAFALFVSKTPFSL